MRESVVALLLAIVFAPTPALASPHWQFQPPPSPSGELEESIAQYQRLAEDLTVTIAQTEIIQRQIDSLQQQIDQRRASVGRIAAASYQTQRADSFHVLFDASSTGEVLQRLLLATAFARRQQQEIESLALVSERYEATKRTLDALIDQQRSQQRALVALRLKIQAATQPVL